MTTTMFMMTMMRLGWVLVGLPRSMLGPMASAQSSVPRPPPPHAARGRRGRHSLSYDPPYYHNNYNYRDDDIHHAERQPQQHQRFLQDAETVNEPSAEQILRQRLLTNYDRGSFPFTTFWASEDQTATERTGVPVALGLNFHRVLDVNPTSSAVDMIVWVRQRWKDPRLTWDPAQHDGIERLTFWVADGSGPGGETSEIWTPDLELWNQQVPLAQSLADAAAAVQSDGTVFWSRPGHVQPVCKFSGLADFPFDTLHCTLEIGSWGYSGLYLRPTKLDDVGYSIGGSETAGEAYQEFDLHDVVCEQHTYPPYPNAPLEDWPVMFYHVSFRRSWQPYARGFVALQVILNVFAFACFWLPPHIGERMSIAITSVLAAVASELVVASKLPAAAELTWFAKFSLVSLLFTAMALLESAAAIHFYYCTDEDLVPSWYRWLQRNVFRTSQVQDENSQTTNSPGGQNNVVSDEDAHETDDTQKVDEEQETSTPRSSLRTSVVFEDAPPPPPQVSDCVESAFASSLSLDETEPRNRPGRAHMDAELAKQMSSFRTRKTVKTILGRDADDFKNAREMENNMKWQRVARKLDETSRLVFPVLFAIFVATSFGRAR